MPIHRRNANNSPPVSIPPSRLTQGERNSNRVGLRLANARVFDNEVVTQQPGGERVSTRTITNQPSRGGPVATSLREQIELEASGRASARIQNTTEEPQTCGGCCSGCSFCSHPAPTPPEEEDDVGFLADRVETKVAVPDKKPKKRNCCQQWCHTYCTAEGMVEQGGDNVRNCAGLVGFVVADLSAAGGFIANVIVHNTEAKAMGTAKLMGIFTSMFVPLLALGACVGCSCGMFCFRRCINATSKVLEADTFTEKVDMAKQQLEINLLGVSDKKAAKKKAEQSVNKRKVQYTAHKNDIATLAEIALEEDEIDPSKVPPDHLGLERLKK